MEEGREQRNPRVLKPRGRDCFEERLASVVKCCPEYTDWPCPVDIISRNREEGGWMSMGDWDLSRIVTRGLQDQQSTKSLCCVWSLCLNVDRETWEGKGGRERVILKQSKIPRAVGQSEENVVSLEAEEIVLGPTSSANVMSEKAEKLDPVQKHL